MSFSADALGQESRAECPRTRISSVSYSGAKENSLQLLSTTPIKTRACGGSQVRSERWYLTDDLH